MGINWRLSAPYFLLTFAASPLQKLFPGRATRWLLMNRRYLGLSFALGAFCQIPPIVTLATRLQPTFAEIHSVSSQFAEDCIYLTFVLMTATSFRAVNRFLSRTTWRRLHASGMYLLPATLRPGDICPRGSDWLHIWGSLHSSLSVLCSDGRPRDDPRAAAAEGSGPIAF
jgi:hypothetical protein